MNFNAVETSPIMQENITPKLAYSVEEISEQTTLSKAFLRNEIRAGRLKVQRFGRRVIVLAGDLSAYLNKEVIKN